MPTWRGEWRDPVGRLHLEAMRSYETSFKLVLRGIDLLWQERHLMMMMVMMCMLVCNLMVLVFVIFDTMLRLIGVVCQVPAHQ